MAVAESRRKGKNLGDGSSAIDKRFYGRSRKRRAKAAVVADVPPLCAPPEDLPAQVAPSEPSAAAPAPATEAASFPAAPSRSPARTSSSSSSSSATPSSTSSAEPNDTNRPSPRPHPTASDSQERSSMTHSKAPTKSESSAYCDENGGHYCRHNNRGHRGGASTDSSAPCGSSSSSRSSGRRHGHRRHRRRRERRFRSDSVSSIGSMYSLSDTSPAVDSRSRPTFVHGSSYSGGDNSSSGTESFRDGDDGRNGGGHHHGTDCSSHHKRQSRNQEDGDSRRRRRHRGDRSEGRRGRRLRGDSRYEHISSKGRDRRRQGDFDDGRGRRGRGTRHSVSFHQRRRGRRSDSGGSVHRCRSGGGSGTAREDRFAREHKRRNRHEEQHRQGYGGGGGRDNNQRRRPYGSDTGERRRKRAGEEEAGGRGGSVTTKQPRGNRQVPLKLQEPSREEDFEQGVAKRSPEAVQRFIMAAVLLQRIFRGFLGRIRVVGRREALARLKRACLGVAIDIIDTHVREDVVPHLVHDALVGDFNKGAAGVQQRAEAAEAASDILDKVAASLIGDLVPLAITEEANRHLDIVYVRDRRNPLLAATDDVIAVALRFCIGEAVAEVVKECAEEFMFDKRIFALVEGFIEDAVLESVGPVASEVYYETTSRSAYLDVEAELCVEEAKSVVSETMAPFEDQLVELQREKDFAAVQMAAHSVMLKGLQLQHAARTVGQRGRLVAMSEINGRTLNLLLAGRFLAILRAAETNRLQVSTSPLLFMLFQRLVVRTGRSVLLEELSRELDRDETALHALELERIAEVDGQRRAGRGRVGAEISARFAALDAE